MTKYQVKNGWHRLNTCKAQYAHLKCEGFEYWYLVSYDSIICRVSHITHNGHNMWNLDLSERWGYSNTTYQHLYKFLAMIPKCPFNSYWLREYRWLHLHNGINTYHFAECCCITQSTMNKIWSYWNTNSCQKNSFPCKIL